MKKRLKTFESAGDGENGAGGHSPELMRLKAENLALQKSLQGVGRFQSRQWQLNGVCLCVLQCMRTVVNKD